MNEFLIEIMRGVLAFGVIVVVVLTAVRLLDAITRNAG